MGVYSAKENSNALWCAICEALVFELTNKARRPKAIWNACYAAGSVLGNKTMPCIRTDEAKHRTLELFRCLLLVLQNSSNFKVRINACAALMAPCTRKHYGGIFGSLWFSLLKNLKLITQQKDNQSYTYKLPKTKQYQEKLADKLTAAVFHMAKLCSPKDLKSKQVRAILTGECTYLGQIIQFAQHSLFVKRKVEYYDEECVSQAYANISQLLEQCTPMYLGEDERMEFEKIVASNGNGFLDSQQQITTKISEGTWLTTSV